MATERESRGALSPWGVRVRATGTAGATAYARVHSFEVGSALPFDVEEGRVTALEYLLGALGGDLIGGFRTLARRRRLAIEEVEATVDATLDNALTHLGVVGEEGHPGLDRVAVRVHVSTLEPEDAVREAWDEALRRSPLLRTLQGAASIEIVMTVTV
jgi:uncharacterized OsmC-like protein